jgi:two-component system phosphate regulon response regulator PhoB
MKRQRVLVIEDDAAMRGFYERFFARLAPEGYVAAVVADGERALSILECNPVDLVVLDWCLPGLSGQTLLKAMRAHPLTRSVGVLIVTGRTSPADEIAALDSGADDHLAKPFDEAVLQARLRSLGRRRELTLAQHQVRRYPGLEFDADSDLVRVGSRRVHLTPKEMGLLAVFLQRPDILHTHAFLWDAVWGYESERWEHLLVVAISSLRRKLGPDWGERLRSHKGKGYSFEAPR